MTINSKLKIYQGIIQYLLDSTGYDLENIAALTNSSIKNIRSLYRGNEIPTNFSSSEKHLVQLYQIILELHIKQGTDSMRIIKETTYENTQHTASC